MNFDKLDVINSIKLFKHLKIMELNYLLKNKNNLDISNHIKETLNKLDETPDYYNVIKKFNDKYESIITTNDVRNSKPTKIDEKNIIKFFNKYDSSKINDFVDNPDLIKDENLKNTFYKLRLHVNPHKFMNDCFESYTKSIKGGSVEKLEDTSDQIDKAQEVINTQSENLQNKIDENQKNLENQLKELQEKRNEYIKKLDDVHEKQKTYINAFWDHQVYLVKTRHLNHQVSNLNNPNFHSQGYMANNQLNPYYYNQMQSQYQPQHYQTDFGYTQEHPPQTTFHY